MSHDLYATWACAEIASIIRNNQPTYFTNSGYPTGWTVGSGREGGRLWPLADGVISSYHSSVTDDLHIAVEFKRTNEGLHGTLTALGQSLAYLHKGYHASIIVIPEKYTSHSSPANHIKDVLDLTANTMPVGVYGYKEPDLTKLNPFENQITCYRQPQLSLSPLVTGASVGSRPKSSTLWAHVREGMSYPDVFYKYCKEVKFVTSYPSNRNFQLLPELIAAVNRIMPTADPIKFLSYTKDDSILDRTWLHVWFNYYFHKNLRPIFTKDPHTGLYAVNAKASLIKQNKSEFANFLSGRKDSLKEKIVEKLNKGSLTEDEAWEEYVRTVRNQAHSYREVIDSGLYHLNLIDSEGNLTKVGYKFVDEADKESSVYSNTAIQILRGAALVYGNFSAFLHYVYQLSEEVFSEEAMYFASMNRKNGTIKFDNVGFKAYLYEKMKDDLSLILTSSIRSPGNPRNAFQAEIPFLKYLGLIDEGTPFRLGTGLLINWPVVQESIEYMNANNL
ncbi:hypothetical protein HX127_14650 [Acinetobacter sp. 256-1]|uniref:hypothetical protein n=1 Tax=Acinetobacter sp. 256-1 TaxID=2746721 RepID=UPI00257612CC|nr:hypothetical protein [Acinetobacter sp. 256-1]MDM1758773.1 hypothetical protein [Acinetobacter sp. 256-1]